jgi:ATP-dependent protease ClpP protease subunit
MNTPGGSVYDGYGMIAKYNEFPNGKKIKVDGRADSFGAFMLCYANPQDVECLDVSSFTFHRAALPTWIESDANYFTTEVKEQLNTINATLRTAIESKCTAQQWKTVTKTSLDDMFSLSSRIDVKLNATQAKKLGIVGNINAITPKKLQEIKAYSQDLAAELFTHIKAEIMTIQDVKANTEVYEAIKADILNAEKDRIGAFVAFKDIDPTAVLEEIVSGRSFTQTFAANMSVKAMSKQGIANLTTASAAPVTTTDPSTEKTKEEKEVEAFTNTMKADLKSRFGIN